MIETHPAVSLHVALLATPVAYHGLLLGFGVGTCTHTVWETLVMSFTFVFVVTLRSRLQLLCKINLHRHGPLVPSRVLTTKLFTFALVLVG